MSEETHGLYRTWRRKFADAFRGIRRGVHGETSFLVHVLAAAGVVLAGLVLRLVRGGQYQLSSGEWSILLLTIVVVLCAEMLNTALETLAAALHPEHHPEVGEALDIASGAVLIVALGSVGVGLIIFLPKILKILALF